MVKEILASSAGGDNLSSSDCPSTPFNGILAKGCQKNFSKETLSKLFSKENLSKNPVLYAACQYRKANISLIPLSCDGLKKPDGTKLPQGETGRASWKPLQDRLPTAEELWSWFCEPEPRGIGLVCGKVSGNLEVIDFDNQAQELFPKWRELVEQEMPGLVERLTIHKTPRSPEGGYHVLYRCPEATIPGNKVLARGPEKEILIETRGEGGYTVAVGSPPNCHETKRPYERLSGPKIPPMVSAEEREVLWACACAFDHQFELVTGQPQGQAKPSGGGRPGEDFDLNGPPWEEILGPLGWVLAGTGSGGEKRWRRPGKERGWSATTGVCKGPNGEDLLRVFSSSAYPFEMGKAYGKFRAYALLNHGGDWVAAARELAKKGYGSQTSASEPQARKPTESEKEPEYNLEIKASVNGSIRAATIVVTNAQGEVLASDCAKLASAKNRRYVGRNLARQLGDEDEEKWINALEKKWHDLYGQYQKIQAQQAAGSPEAAELETAQLLPTAPACIRKPLTLINGQSYATTWGIVQQTVSQKFDEETGTVPRLDRPVQETKEVLLIIRNDGQLFCPAPLPGAKPLKELEVELGIDINTFRNAVQPGREWSAEGVQAFLEGKRPNPAEVFERVVRVIDRFVDFDRSLAPQKTMCELVACYIISTYFLDAFNVVGYLWPNGDRGCGKTQFLHVVSEMAYLGEVILAGCSYPCLRDLADYGATLAFDDAESVMDVRRTDPNKRNLLLAGSRKGATVVLKELVDKTWVSRRVSTFCPRLFSAIRLPDEVLGSRSIIIPLIRSSDPHRAKSSPTNPKDWPVDRRQLVDELWALGLTHLPEMPQWDQTAAEYAHLQGRNLDPWRPILAVAAWLETKHGLRDLYSQLEKLSCDYQIERGEIEATDKTRVLLKALWNLSADWGKSSQTLRSKEIADAMNKIAQKEDLTNPGQDFVTPKPIGQLMKKLRFHSRPQRSAQGKTWIVNKKEVIALAKNYGVMEEVAEREPGAEG